MRSTIQVFGRFAHSVWAMPNLYFCQPGHRNTGMLRAVLTPEECGQIFRPGDGTFLGDRFPDSLCGNGLEKDFSIVAIATSEVTEEWRVGFHRFDVDLADLNEKVLGLAK